MADTYRRNPGLYDNVGRSLRRAETLAATHARRRAGERKQLRQNLWRDAEAELQEQAQLAREVL